MLNNLSKKRQYCYLLTEVISLALGKVEICGIDTSDLPMLTAEKMNILMKKSKDGDQEARKELIHGNLRLVLSVIQKFQNRGENVDDLFQVGCIGLMKALDNFDMTLNVRPSTYCVPMIIGEIRRYLRDNNSIRVSRSIRDTAYRALKIRDELTEKKNKDPKISDISKAMDVPEEDVIIALEAIQDPVSLFEPIYQEGGDAIYIMDQIRDQSISEEDWVRDLSIKNALSRLGARERGIIEKRFFQGKTQMEVAQEIGISQAQVSRLEKNALNQMKKNI